MKSMLTKASTASFQESQDETGDTSGTDEDATQSRLVQMRTRLLEKERRRGSARVMKSTLTKVPRNVADSCELTATTKQTEPSISRGRVVTNECRRK